MVPLSVTSDEEELIRSVTRSKLVKIEDNSVELLPLRQVGGNTGVSLVDETEIRAEIIEGAGVCGVEVLQKIASDGAVDDVLGRSNGVVEAGGGRCGGGCGGDGESGGRGGRRGDAMGGGGGDGRVASAGAGAVGAGA